MDDLFVDYLFEWILKVYVKAMSIPAKETLQLLTINGRTMGR